MIAIQGLVVIDDWYPRLGGYLLISVTGLGGY